MVRAYLVRRPHCNRRAVLVPQRETAKPMHASVASALLVATSLRQVCRKPRCLRLSTSDVGGVCQPVGTSSIGSACQSDLDCETLFCAALAGGGAAECIEPCVLDGGTCDSGSCVALFGQSIVGGCIGTTSGTTDGVDSNDGTDSAEGADGISGAETSTDTTDAYASTTVTSSGPKRSQANPHRGPSSCY